MGETWAEMEVYFPNKLSVTRIASKILYDFLRGRYSVEEYQTVINSGDQPDGVRHLPLYFIYTA